MLSSARAIMLYMSVPCARCLNRCTTDTLTDTARCLLIQLLTSTIIHDSARARPKHVPFLTSLATSLATSLLYFASLLASVCLK